MGITDFGELSPRCDRIATGSRAENYNIVKRRIIIKKLISIFLAAGMILAAADSSVFATGIKAAVVKSWDGNAVEPVFAELNNNWAKYGGIPLTIDTSLRLVSSFSHQDLVDTGADVLWLSNPAGGSRLYSEAEIVAINQYVSEGHSILGTYRVFQGADTDNRGLAPIFGLHEDITYNTQIVSANRTFNILDTNHPLLFQNIPSPYDSNGSPSAQVPADDFKWNGGDFDSAELLAQTSDKRGIITWYETDSYHAIFISEMPEFTGMYDDKYCGGNPADTQLLYNALTVPEPTTIALLTLGAFAFLKRKREKR